MREISPRLPHRYVTRIALDRRHGGLDIDTVQAARQYCRRNSVRRARATERSNMRPSASPTSRRVETDPFRTRSRRRSTAEIAGAHRLQRPDITVDFEPHILNSRLRKAHELPACPARDRSDRRRESEIEKHVPASVRCTPSTRISARRIPAPRPTSTTYRRRRRDMAHDGAQRRPRRMQTCA